MIHFKLNIDLFYDIESKNDSILKAIACIEYPILHVIAKSLETVEEEYDELDRFIIKTAYEQDGFSISDFAEITGLSPSIFEFRVKELINQNLVSLIEGDVIPIEEGTRFLNDPLYERNIVRTRSFLLDGITHKPLNAYFYKEGKENLISENDKDSYGNRILNPSIIHTPPSNKVVENILEVTVEQRADYNIPIGLKKITDYDFILMTYPLAIALGKSSNGKLKKKLIDINGFYANEKFVSQWQDQLKSEIENIEIVIEEKDVIRDSESFKKIHFKNNWSKLHANNGDKIFCIEKEKLKHFVSKLYNLERISDDNLILNEANIEVKVDCHLFESKGADKKKLIEACVRKRDYYRQNEGTGVWLVFFDIIVEDEYIKELVDLYNLLRDGSSLQALLLFYNNNYRKLRRNLIAIEQFDKLEELDTFLFLHLRENSFNQFYLTIANE